MTDLMELASRVEAGEGPDRDLDAEIKEAVGHMWDYAADWGPRGHDKPVAFAYTASLDAAMTLVPEGWRIWTADFSIESRFVWMLCGPKLTWITLEDGSREGGEDWYQSGGGKTAALALSAAALRARAHQGAAYVDQ